MTRKAIGLSEQAFVLINGPLVFFDFFASIFYAWCLIFTTSNKQNPKQPLKALLGVLVWWSLLYCFLWTIIYSLLKQRGPFLLYFLSWLLLLYNVQNSFTSCVWMNFYYYTQIVPSRRALFMWVKRNITFVIYTLLFFNGAVFLCVGVRRTADIVVSINKGTYANSTSTEQLTGDPHLISEFSFYIINAYLFFCLCIMAVSSFSTVLYLYRHMKSMSKSGNTFTSASLRSQMRVTISGICQGVFCTVFTALYLLGSFSYHYSPDVYFGTWVQFTVTTLYVSVTTFNLGISQTIFRQRAASVWKDLRAMCVKPS